MTYSPFGNLTNSAGHRFHLSILTHIITFEGQYAVIGISIIVERNSPPKCCTTLIRSQDLRLSPEMEMNASYSRFSMPEIAYKEDTSFF